MSKALILNYGNIVRFSTHIDYMYANKEFLKDWTCKEVIHHTSDASDHKPVIATFVEHDTEKSNEVN